MLGYEMEPQDKVDRAATHRCARGVSLNTLDKHMFIGGVPGSGKTLLIIAILIQLFARGVPFLCFAPIKNDFRALLRLTDPRDPAGRELRITLRVLTVGNDAVSPYRQSILTLQPGISAHAHIEALLSVILPAALPWSGPLPGIIGEALEIVYDNAARKGRPPLLSQVVSVARVILHRRYRGDTSKNVGGAIDTRLGLMTRRNRGRICQCYRNTLSIDELMRGYTVIEFDRSESEEEMCLHVLTQLVMLRERLKTLPPYAGGLRFCLVMDELHRILGRQTSARPSEDNPDSKAYVTDAVCRILAELRALGVGVILADQRAADVAAAVLAETATKIALRQVSEADRQAMGSTMLLDPLSIDTLARLGVGEAFFYTEGLYIPRRIRTVDLRDRVDFTPMSDGELRALLLEQAWFIECKRPPAP